jgi:hypothetical protein
MSMYLRISIVPLVPTITTRPSPQVGSPLGGEPVDANIPRGAGRAQQHLAKILQLGMVRICPVGYGRGCHFGILCTGEEEELLDLVRRSR